MGSKWHWLLIISKAQIFLVVSCLPPRTSLMLHHANEYKCYLYLVSVTSQTWWVRQSKWQKMFITCILAQGVLVLHCTHACVMTSWDLGIICRNVLFSSAMMEWSFTSENINSIQSIFCSLYLHAGHVLDFLPNPYMPAAQPNCPLELTTKLLKLFAFCILRVTIYQ